MQKRQMYTVKAQKRGISLPDMKGPKAMKTRANMNVHGVKEAKSSFRMVRNLFRVEREREKNFEKFTQNCPV